MFRAAYTGSNTKTTFLDALKRDTSIAESATMTTTVLQPSLDSSSATGIIAAAATIRGYFQDGKFSWAVSSNSEDFASKIKTALIWTLPALQSPHHDTQELCSWIAAPSDVGPVKIGRLETANAQSYCWTMMFANACVVLPPLNSYTPSSKTEGLMIDFEILLEIAAVDRKVTTSDGILFIGFDTALVTLDPPESRRWHFLLTDGRQIADRRIHSRL